MLSKEDYISNGWYWNETSGWVWVGLEEPEVEEKIEKWEWNVGIGWILIRE